MPGLRAFSNQEYKELLDELRMLSPGIDAGGWTDPCQFEVHLPEDVFDELCDELEDLAQRRGHQIIA